jgi:hypothetical protein
MRSIFYFKEFIRRNELKNCIELWHNKTYRGFTLSNEKIVLYFDAFYQLKRVKVL